MTKDEIMEMVPGRELDVLIATKVMGRDDSFGVLTTTRMVMDDTCGRKLPDGYKKRTPYYSTDISAAWKVVERLYPITIYHHSTIGDEVGYRVTIGGVIITGQTAPETICKAALLTIERRIDA